MNNLFDFLTDLATNPKKQVAFAQSPTAVMDASLLTEAERAIITSKDKAKITAAFADELPILSIAHREPDTDPSPDPDPTPDPDSSPDPEPSEEN